jgi:hypothetical protein
MPDICVVSKATYDTYLNLLGENMAGLYFGSTGKSLSIEQVKNGYIITIGYDKYVFRTLKQVNEAVSQYYSQPVKEQKED